METFISGEAKGELFFSLTSSSLGCIFLRFGLVGGIVAFSSIGSGSYKRRNLSLKIFNIFGQLVLEKLDKRLHCLFLSIFMCKTRIFLLWFVSFFHCIPPSPALGGNKRSSFLLNGDHLCIVYLLWTWKYSLYFLISFYESYFVLFSFSDLPRFIFASWLFVTYSFGKPELHIFGFLLLHRHSCFLTLCLAYFSEIW